MPSTKHKLTSWKETKVGVERKGAGGNTDEIRLKQRGVTRSKMDE